MSSARDARSALRPASRNVAAPPELSIVSLCDGLISGMRSARSTMSAEWSAELSMSRITALTT